MSRDIESTIDSCLRTRRVMKTRSLRRNPFRSRVVVVVVVSGVVLAPVATDARMARI